MAKSHKGITRIDYEGVTTRGWMVRMTRAGKRKQQFFNDREHGGKAKSFKAAQDCYASWVQEAPPISTSKNLKTQRNKTGKVGVHLIRNVDSRWENAESFGYCASWVTEAGERKKLSFAWKRYGKKNAWTLACLAREKEIEDREKVVAMLEKLQPKNPKK